MAMYSGVLLSEGDLERYQLVRAEAYAMEDTHATDVTMKYAADVNLREFRLVEEFRETYELDPEQFVRIVLTSGAIMYDTDSGL